MKIKNSEILKELIEHSPFTLTATLTSIIAMSFLLIKQNLMQYAILSFEIFHPGHIFFSSLVSAAIFYNYQKKFFRALFSGILIAVIIGSISDIIFPYLGSLLFSIPISFHLPVIESPVLILGVSLTGCLTGIAIKKTKFPHFIHVLLSVFASLLYIFSYSADFSFIRLFFIFLVSSISVVIPCCLSDIVFPLLVKKRLRLKKEK